MSDRRRVRLLLDSGAFTAWKRGEPLSLSDYIAFIKRNEQLLWRYVNLDAIPDKPHTLDVVEASAKQSSHNLQTMLDAGLKPIPVFHQGERFIWLERMLKNGHDYIGISTDKKEKPDRQRRWLDRAFSIVPHNVKTHGFGITKSAFVAKYRFFSVDSTTWVKSAGYGEVYVPSPDGDIEPFLLAVSEEHRRDRSRSFFKADRDTQLHVHAYVKAAGRSMFAVENSPEARQAINLRYFTEFVLCRFPQWVCPRSR